MINFIKHIIVAFVLLLSIGMTASEKDSIVVVGNVLYENSAKQLDYLYSYNKSKKEKSWYIFFLGAEVEDLQYILNNSAYSNQYDVGKLTKLNEKLTKINNENPDYEVYAAITDFNKVLKITSLFEGEKLSKHIEQIEDQLSIDPTSKSQEQIQLRETKQALVNFSTIKVSILDSIYNRTTAFKQSSKKNHFLPYIMNLTYEKMANYEEDAQRKQFFVWGVHPEKKEKAFNKNYLNELYQRYKVTPDKSNIYRFAEVQLESVIKSLELFVSLPKVENLKEGIGQEVYQLFANGIQDGSDQEKKLVELSNYLTDNYNGEHFVVDNSGCLNYNCEVKEDLITVLSDLNIKTIAEFEDAFKFKGVARRYEGRKNVFTTYYSKYDLWVDLDKENYNKNSFDYHIQDGGDWSYEKSADYVEITDRYYYSLKDLLMRYDVFKNPQYSGIKSQIIVRESIGQASSISYEDFYDQYTSKYNTNASYPFIAEWSSRWAEAPLIAYSGYKLVLDFGPFLIEELTRQIGKAGLEKIIREKGKDALQGAIIDIGIQATINYLFYEQFETFEEASQPENINWVSVGWSAAESSIEYRDFLNGIIISSSGSCFVNGYTDAGGFKENFDYRSCAENIAINYVLKRLFKIGGSPYIKEKVVNAFAYGKERVKSLFIKRGIPSDKADELIKTIEKGTDNTINPGNIWDDIVVQGKKGIKNVLVERYKTIGDFINSAEYISKVADDFAKYRTSGGVLVLAKYKVKHKTITSNRMQGNIAETVFKDLEGGMKPKSPISTLYGNRYIDNILDGTGREVKSGLLTLTKEVKRQILKDIEILDNAQSLDVLRIEWHCLNGIDNKVLEFAKDELVKFGLPSESFRFIVY